MTLKDIELNSTFIVEEFDASIWSMIKNIASIKFKYLYV